MRANEFILEIFEPRKKDWEWVFRGSEEATADFNVGKVPYRFHAYSNGENDWEVEFKVRTTDDSRNTRQNLKTRFGLTGTGNSTEVMSTVVDIMREFLAMYHGKIDTIGFTAEEPSRQKLYMRMMKRLLPDWDIHTYDAGSGLGFTVVAPENLEEVFQPGKTNWKWARLGRDDVRALFQVGDRQYVWDAFTHRANPKKWEVQFRLVRNDNDPDNLDLFGTTGTGNSAEVLSTAVDITRAFLKDYGLDNVEEITFNAKEDSRIGLYAKMIKRLLPDWDLHSKKDPYDGMVFTLTDRRAYDKPENKLDELFDPQTSYELEWDNSFGPKEMHARAYDRQGKYIDIRFVPVREGIVDIEFSKMDNFDLTHDQDAPRVFATVLNAVETYLRGYQPKIILFSGKEKSRKGLYQRLINRFASRYGYKQLDTTKLSPKAQEQLGTLGTNLFVLQKNTKTVDEASYEGNLGMMEMMKFFKLATQDEKDYMKSLLAQGMQEEAWELLQQVTGEELVDEGVWDTIKHGAAAGAIALGALGAGNADAKVNHAPMKPGTYQKVDKAQKAEKPEAATYNALSNNLNNEIIVHKAAKKAGLRGAELAQFLAQMKHESWDFGRLKEKSQPGVKGYFAKRYDMKYSPKTAKILGNTHAGDGEKYHGRGFVQLTGRDNYRMAGEALGIDLLHKPELAAKPEVAAKIAVWYWQTRVKPHVQNFADTSAVTKRINPALRGVQDRHENFKDYMRII